MTEIFPFLQTAFLQIAFLNLLKLACSFLSRFKEGFEPLTLVSTEYKMGISFRRK